MGRPWLWGCISDGQEMTFEDVRHCPGMHFYSTCVAEPSPDTQFGIMVSVAHQQEANIQMATYTLHQHMRRKGQTVVVAV